MDTPAGEIIYHCQSCKATSTVKEAFVEQGKNTGEYLCFQCTQKKSMRSLAFSVLGIFGLGVLMLLLVPEMALGAIYLTLCAAYLLMVPLILLHELSHALMASLLKIRVFVISLGTGPLLASWRMFGIRWHLNLYPLMGITIAPVTKRPHLRRDIFLLHLAGPALHAVLIVGLLALWLTIATPETGAWIHYAFAAALGSNTLLLIGNLYPRKAAQSTGHALATDGLAMINAFKKPIEDLQKLDLWHYVYQVNDAVDRKDPAAAQKWAEQGLALYPQDLNMLNIVGYAHANAHEYAAARVIFHQLLSNEPPPQGLMRYLALNNIAYCHLMLQDLPLYAEADAYSEEAHRNVQWEPAFISTRGSVLVEKGCYEEGIALLKTAMARSPFTVDKAASACYIAIAEARRGDPSAARQYLNAARKLDPANALVERAEIELERRGQA